jgi:hypothetical protein
MTSVVDEGIITAARIVLDTLEGQGTEPGYRITDAVIIALADMVITSMARTGLLESLLTDEQRAAYDRDLRPDEHIVRRAYIRGELEAIMAGAMLGQIDPEP